MELGSPRFSGILAPRGRHGVAKWGQGAKIGKIGRLGRPTRVCFRGQLVGPNHDSQVFIYPYVLCIGLWLAVTLASYCSPGDRHGTWQKTGRNAQLGNVDRTVSCITPARLEEQIRKRRANDSWSYTTRIALFLRLGALPHGDMVFPTSPKMVKTAKLGRNCPYPQSHTSMAMANNY